MSIDFDVSAYAPGGGIRSRMSRRMVGLRWSVRISAVFLILLPLIAIAAPLIAPHDPEATSLTEVFGGASGAHLLGTDELGRDILSRLIFATRVSLLAPLAVIVISGLLGLAIAVTMAWRGGRFDSSLSAVIDVLLGFPALLLALVAVAIFGVGETAPIIALVIAYTPYFARLIRAVASRERSLPYVSALTVAGYGGWRISIRHIVPNIAPFLVTQAAVMFGYAITDLAAISFLGVGVQPPTADWGSMVADGQSGVLEGAPLQSLSAGLLIVLTVISLNIVGEAVAERSAGGRR